MTVIKCNKIFCQCCYRAKQRTLPDNGFLLLLQTHTARTTLPASSSKVPYCLALDLTQDRPRRPRCDLPALCHTAKLSPTRRPEPQVTAYRVSKPVVAPRLARPAAGGPGKPTHALTLQVTGGGAHKSSRPHGKQAQAHTHTSSDGVTRSVYVAS